ncbi:MFS monocarboxylate transporter [Perkinsela sp. CCAP 1560/4]|nr:MFS monocarboxylate transporter [Perkinsela sp. CCAP 1560/4]|eukprot:KNH09213.1 MFS monocarboxylate transporter [Perkinsela sp. CCAP 1560/4]
MLSNRLRDLYLRYASKGAAVDNSKRKSEIPGFRDIRDDKALLQTHGDLFSSLKLLRYGSEYAIDYGLQRELDYNQIDALRELGLNEGKLLEGPMRLLKSGIPFPTISELRTFADYREGSKRALSLTYRSFKKPTLVHIAHGMSTGEVNASLWNEIVPREGGAPVLDIVTMHNFQTVSTKLFQRIVLLMMNQKITDSPGQHYFGQNLLPRFMPTFDIRNFILNYVMLVDHKGHVRWMSGWKPNEEEKRNFPMLCRALADVYSTP